MRNKIKNLLSNTIVLKYRLPTGNIKKTDLSTLNDKCFSVSSNEALSDLIYNGISEYAIGEKHIDIEDLDKCQRKVLLTRLRYNENATEEEKQKYGFFGEVILDLILQSQFESKVLLAKGYFYNPLSQEESKGYDAYQFYYSKEEGLSLLLGESKFYIKFQNAVNDVMKKLNNSTSFNYFNKNILALINEKNNFDSCPNEISSIIEKWETNPDICFYEEIKKNNIKLCYPILLLYDQTKTNYDDTIKETIYYIDRKLKELNIKPEMEIDFLFFFIPVISSKKVKENVIKWISEKKPVI